MGQIDVVIGSPKFCPTSAYPKTLKQAAPFVAEVEHFISFQAGLTHLELGVRRKSLEVS
jgi:hypothetical protein